MRNFLKKNIDIPQHLLFYTIQYDVHQNNNKLTTTLQYKSIQMYCDNLLSNITE